MPNAANRGLPDEYSERPKVFRTTVTLPASLEGFVKTRAAQPKFMGNVSGYIRDLILEDQSGFVGPKKRKVKARRDNP